MNQAEKLRTQSDLAKWRREAASLMDTQLWSLGHDIRRVAGNLLLDAGCEKTPAPRDLECSSCYQVMVGVTRIAFRGFGVLCESAGEGCLFISRDGFTLRWAADIPNGWVPWRCESVETWSGIPASRRELCVGLAAMTASWFAEYETLIAATHGIDYRKATLAERDSRQTTDPQTAGLARRWGALASDVRRDPALMGQLSPPNPRKRRKKARALESPSVDRLSSRRAFVLATK